MDDIHIQIIMPMAAPAGVIDMDRPDKVGPGKWME